MEAEMRRLKLELKQTMEMYNTACKEALTAQQKVWINIWLESFFSFITKKHFHTLRTNQPFALDPHCISGFISGRAK